MNVNLYINDELAKQLDMIVLSTDKKRNSLIQEAIYNLVKSYRGTKWPDAILNFKGIEDLSDWDGFEQHRQELKKPDTEIF